MTRTTYSFAYPNIDIDDVHVEFCWHDCSEAPDYYGEDTIFFCTDGSNGILPEDAQKAMEIIRQARGVNQ